MNQLQRALKMNPIRLMKKILCFEEIYTIAYRNRDEHTLLDSDILSFDRIPFDENYWYADPILFSHGGKDYLLMESFDMRTQLGSIACSEFDAAGRLSEPRIIIQEAYHMSFPMVFFWNDRLYMIPETCENRSVNLYCCEGDIYSWKLLKSFPVEEALVDTVAVACYEDSVELITSAIHENHMRKFAWRKYRLCRDGEDYRLEADTAFPANKDYGYGFRMAGALITEGDTPILPTQVSTDVDYGLYLNLNDFSGRDVTMMPVRKKVTVDSILLPDVKQKNHIGVHSYGLSHRVEVVDMRYFRFLPRSRMRKIWNKVRKLLCIR